MRDHRESNYCRQYNGTLTHREEGLIWFTDNYSVYRNKKTKYFVIYFINNNRYKNLIVVNFPNIR